MAETRTKAFHQADYAAKLRVPEGMPFVNAEKAEDIRAALGAGQAAFVQSCNGKAFIWKEGGVTRVDHFFFGPPQEIDFTDEAEAVDYASGFCG